MDGTQARAALVRGLGNTSEVDLVGATLRTRGAADHVDLPRLLAAWAATAVDVNDPSWTVDDYTNELTGRDLLETAMDLSSSELRERIRSIATPHDDEFIAKTVPDDDGVLAARYRTGEGWWWTRVPRTASWR